MKPMQLTRDCILSEASRARWGGGVFVQYRGPNLKSLLAAKCITPSMYRAFRKPSPGVRRLDADGDSIRQVRRGKRVEVTLRIKSDAKALRLPGVRKLIHQSEAASTPVRLARIALEAESESKKQRAVGRFQRHVEWANCGNVIVPNWSALVAARFAQVSS